MKKLSYLSTHTTAFKITLLWLFVLGGLAGCQKAPETNQPDQLKVFIDSLDRDSRQIGIKNAIRSLDSLMSTLGTKSLKDRIQYYKFMKVLPQGFHVGSKCVDVYR